MSPGILLILPAPFMTATHSSSLHPRKRRCLLSRVGMLALFLLASPLNAEPILKSWFTEYSGRYARIYETIDDEAAGNAITTWSRGQGTQSLPTYAGVHEISYTDTDVYIRTTNLGFHIMGPWYLNAAKTNLFPNYPANRSILYRFPRTPGTPPANKTLTGLGAIGYFVDGISMFDSRDAFSYSNANGVDSSPNNGITGDGVWNREAYTNESVTFDAANAHQAGPNHHYHANPPGLRHLLGDSVDHDARTNTYSENFNGKHSPILGWVRDGYPVYGPYGYSDPNDPASAVTRMVTGYQPRPLANGTARSSLPLWVTTLEGRSTTIAANLFGPDVSTAFPLGKYMEDYDYKGDLGQAHGVDFDLNQFNGRVCVTPEFPNGTFAYFVSIDAAGTPTFPYNIGRAYFGNPTGDNAATIPAQSTTFFEGGPEREAKVNSIVVDETVGDVVLTWTAAEGGRYLVESSTDGNSWADLPIKVSANAARASLSDGGRGSREELGYYKPRMESLDAFDDAGFDYDNNVIGAAKTTIVVTLTSGGGTLPPANLATLPNNITFNGVPVTLISRPSQYSVEIEVDTESLADGTYAVNVTWPDSIAWSGNYAHVSQPNILLLIVDDWGTDSSPIDNNTTANPGTTFPTMATLESLAANGLRFTNAYAQPICSPTRASIMTGRYGFRTGVGNPGDAIVAAETTLPEAFTSAGSPYQLASFGKWHLGGGNTGYDTLGGWPHFVGITAGGVPEQTDGYVNWTKNSNGATANSTTYSTTDQVNEAKTFIDAKNTAGAPWFVWMGFNAPHTPFHEPPSNLLQGKTGTSNRGLYEKSLEALDTEIGRLLQSVDLSKTNVILIGDNGTPTQVAQAPYDRVNGDTRAKGTLFQGGIHVPCVVRGPAVQVASGSITDKMIQVTDLFSTILEMADVPVPATAIDSRSILPILSGGDTAQREIVSEAFGGNVPGRALRLDTSPDFKLIIFGDPSSTADDPEFQFFNTTLDGNEAAPLDIANLTGEALDAYNALVARDAQLGGGFSDPATGPEDTLYIELAVSTGPAGVPANLNAAPISVTVDGVTANIVGRLDQTDTAARYWVKCDITQAPPYNRAVVTFENNPNTGDARVFNSINIVVAP